jgi:undecaprenyl diphosphate synthase
MIDPNKIPRHVAIIMDGNGRWAAERGFPRTIGHREGVKRARDVVRAAASLGVEVLTLFAFSTENWNRPDSEIKMLMRYLDNFLEREVDRMHKNNIRFKVIGEEKPLPAAVLKRIKKAQDKTRQNTGLTVVVALNYGSRQEIVEAAKKFARDVLGGRESASSLDAEKFGRYLYTREFPDPDLLIRTSGEARISNFLLWQLSYAELYFTKVLWPDFTADEFICAIEKYQARERRFGGL